ncbi:MAG: universal stress protein [Caldilineaceae bacterium]
MSEQEQVGNDRRSNGPRGSASANQAREGGADDLVIQRIVVALDATTQSANLLEAAAHLAHHLGIELVGLFVEDVNLLRLSELPFTQEIGSFSQLRRPLQATQLALQLRSQATQLQRMVMRAAERYGVSWSFQVVRGPIAAELRKAAVETDLFVLGRNRRRPRGPAPLGSTTRAVVIEAPRLTMVFHQQAQWQQPIVVAFDGSPAAIRALDLATQLTQAAEDVPLVVILIGEEPERADDLRRAAAAWLHQRGTRARFQWLARANVSRLVNLVMLAHGGAFIAPSNGLAPGRGVACRT